MKKKVFSLQELRDTPDDVDLIERFGKHAEFQGKILCYTLFGWALSNDHRLARRLMTDVDVNACCRTGPGKSTMPVDLAVSCAGFTLSDRVNILSLLVIHGADLKRVRSSTLRINEWLRDGSNVDILGNAQSYAKEFRAKLCAIFWVTQSVDVWRDMGEPLVERVFMSTLSD